MTEHTDHIATSFDIALKELARSIDSFPGLRRHLKKHGHLTTLHYQPELVRTDGQWEFRCKLLGAHAKGAGARQPHLVSESGATVAEAFSAFVASLRGWEHVLNS